MARAHAKTLFGLIVAGASIGACASPETQVVPPVVLAMNGAAPPTYDDGQTQLYEAYLPVPLPLRRPGDGERPSGTVDPYPRPPFQLASQTRIAARYTVSNLDNVPHAVELLVNPWNEFVRYSPGVVTNATAITPNLAGIDRFVILPPLGRVAGIVTPDDFVELATDLGTAMALQKRPPPDGSDLGGPLLYNRAFDVQNRSSQFDPLLAPYVPGVAAGIVGFDLGLRAAELAKVAIEVIVDIEDLDGDRVLPSGDDTSRVGRPGTALTPPAAPPR